MDAAIAKYYYWQMFFGCHSTISRFDILSAESKKKRGTEMEHDSEFENVASRAYSCYNFYLWKTSLTSEEILEVFLDEYVK